MHLYFKQTGDSGSNEHAEDDTAAVKEDILDGSAASGNKELVDFIQDGVHSADEEGRGQEMLLSTEPAFQADAEKETQYGKDEHMGGFPRQALGENGEGSPALFVAFADGIEKVKLKETGIPHGIPDRGAESFGLLLLLGREEENGDHDDEYQCSTEASDPGLLQGI